MKVCAAVLPAGTDQTVSQRAASRRSRPTNPPQTADNKLNTFLRQQGSYQPHCETVAHPSSTSSGPSSHFHVGHFRRISSWRVRDGKIHITTNQIDRNIFLVENPTSNLSQAILVRSALFSLIFFSVLKVQAVLFHVIDGSMETHNEKRMTGSKENFLNVGEDLRHSHVRLLCLPLQSPAWDIVATHTHTHAHTRTHPPPHTHTQPLHLCDGNLVFGSAG